MQVCAEIGFKLEIRKASLFRLCMCMSVRVGGWGLNGTVRGCESDNSLKWFLLFSEALDLVLILPAASTCLSALNADRKNEVILNF